MRSNRVRVTKNGSAKFAFCLTFIAVTDGAANGMEAINLFLQSIPDARH
jgi:hypothetical protein